MEGFGSRVVVKTCVVEVRRLESIRLVDVHGKGKAAHFAYYRRTLRGKA